jgi:hypothetical protein
MFRLDEDLSGFYAGAPGESPAPPGALRDLAGTAPAQLGDSDATVRLAFLAVCVNGRARFASTEEWSSPPTPEEAISFASSVSGQAQTDLSERIGCPILGNVLELPAHTLGKREARVTG